MMKIFVMAISLATFSFCCQASQLADKVMVERCEFLDQSRQRQIPCEVYSKPTTAVNVPVVIISHGYGVKNSEYSCIARPLADRGYFVISIQHDLDTDPVIPKVGNLFERRLPLWERGTQNIMFVISELKRRHLHLNTDKVILIGHSNGGDMSMLFATKYPEKVLKVISLDSLRYPFPTKGNVPILSLRGNDTKADEGVLPTQGATIIDLEQAKHIDLCDRGSVEVKGKMVDYIQGFLAADRSDNKAK
jgi:peptidoglycan-N-acetylglucosamine deacetylase